MIRRIMSVLVMALSLGMAPLVLRAEPVVVQVSTAAALQEAISSASAGMVIELAPGNYGRLDLRRLVMPDGQPLVLRGAPGQDAPVLTSLRLREVENLVLENLVFDYTFTPGDRRHMRPFQIISSRGVTVRHCLFDGDVARGVSTRSDGFGTAFGLTMRRSDQVTLESSEIRGFFRGLVVASSSHINILGNDLHDIRMDGMNFAQVDGVRIERNYIHDFRRSLTSGDHADMIQFWTKGTTEPSRDIVIRDNVLNSGGGWYTQSIFMRNEMVDQGDAGAEMYYRNVLITDNVIINAHLHGVTLGATDGAIVSNNTVIRNARSQGERDNVDLWNPRISVARRSHNVQILRNVTSRIVGYEDQDDWVFADNVMVQDQGRLARGLYYDMVFVDALRGDPQDLGSFAYLPGGVLDGTGLGASRLTSPDPTPPNMP